MAAIDFPNSPTNGQTHTEAGTTWVYDSTHDTWTVQREGALVPVTLQTWDLDSDHVNAGTSELVAFESDASLEAGDYLVIASGYVLHTNNHEAIVKLKYAGFTLNEARCRAAGTTSPDQIDSPVALHYAGTFADGYDVQITTQSGTAGVVTKAGFRISAVKVG